MQRREFSDISNAELNALEKSSITKSIPKVFVEACIDHLDAIQNTEWVSKKSFNADGTPKKATGLQYMIMVLLNQDRPNDTGVEGRLFLNPKYASKDLSFLAPGELSPQELEKLDRDSRIKYKSEVNQRLIKHYGLQKCVDEVLKQFKNADSKMMEKIMTDISLAMMSNERFRAVLRSAYPDGSREQNILCNQIVVALAYKMTCLCQDQLAQELTKKYEAEGIPNPKEKAGGDAFQICTAPLGFKRYDFAENTEAARWQEMSARQVKEFPPISKAAFNPDSAPIQTSKSEPLPGQKPSKDKSTTARSMDALGVSPAVARKDAKQMKEAAEKEARRQAQLEQIKAEAERLKEAKAKGLVGEMPDLGGGASPRKK